MAESTRFADDCVEDDRVRRVVARVVPETSWITDLALGPDGSLYIADSLNHRIRKVSTSGTITTIAGSGATGTGGGALSGDGGLATLARFNTPSGVDVGPDGVVYIADSGNGRVRVVGLDGIARTVAGTGGTATTGNDGPGITASLGNPVRVRVAVDGSVFIAESSGHVVRRLARDGLIHPFAGFWASTASGYAGDGGPAKRALLKSPMDIAVQADGSVLILDQNNTIRLVSPAGTISTFAGFPGTNGYGGDGGYAAATPFGLSRGVRTAPDGTVYLAATTDNRVIRIGAALPGYSGNGDFFSFPTPDGRYLDWFDERGRHMETDDTLTGAAPLIFGYDPQNRLSYVVSDAGQTQFNRDASGNLSSIVGPFNQKTTFTVDSNGYLKTAEDPDHHVTSFTYSADGLMATKTDANNGLSQYFYDSVGRLKEDRDPTSHSKLISRTSAPGSFTVTSTSSLGRATAYTTGSGADASFNRSNLGPDLLTRSLQFSSAGISTTTTPDGTITTTKQLPDPRYGMLSPTEEVTTILPTTRLKRTLAVSRSAIMSGLNLSRLRETTSLNGAIWIRDFDASTNAWTTTSPAGRTTTVAINSRGWPVTFSVPGIQTRSVFYDVFTGHVSQISSGTRTQSFGYFSTSDSQNGYLQTDTNALSQVTSFTRDSFGRALSVTTPSPDLAQTAFGFDPVGNRTSVTPPGATSPPNEVHTSEPTE